MRSSTLLDGKTHDPERPASAHAAVSGPGLPDLARHEATEGKVIGIVLVSCLALPKPASQQGGGRVLALQPHRRARRKANCFVCGRRARGSAPLTTIYVLAS